jgi:glycosyltransferase involved in cell wall biosynthesis
MELKSFAMMAADASHGQTGGGGSGVCWLFPHFHPVLAGAAERFRRYAPTLTRDGFQLEVITARDPSTLPATEVVDAILPVTRMTVSPQAGQRDLTLYRAAAARLSAEPARGVVQTIKSGRHLLPSLLKIRRSGRRLVQVCTMVEPGVEGLPPVQRIKTRVATWLSFLPYSSIITSSTVMSDWHRQFGVPAKKMHVIPNGVDTTRFRPPTDEFEKKALRESLDLPPYAMICLFAGNMIPRKRPHLLVKAWEKVRLRHPDAILLLVGPALRPTIGSASEGTEISGYQQALFQAISAAGSSVRWLAERTDMERIFQAADIFAFPTEQEGFGNVLLEAMAVGLPVLSAQYRGYPEKELEGTVCLVGESADDWAVALSDLMNNREARQTMSQKGRVLIDQRFRVEKIIAMLESVYLGQHPSWMP